MILVLLNLGIYFPTDLWSISHAVMKKRPSDAHRDLLTFKEEPQLESMSIAAYLATPSKFYPLSDTFFRKKYPKNRRTQALRCFARKAPSLFG